MVYYFLTIQKRFLVLNALLMSLFHSLYHIFSVVSPSYMNEARLYFFKKSFILLFSQLQEFSMDIYLRQSWVDPRLGLTRFGINYTVTLNGQDIIDDIWKPDLFFRNLKTAKFHMVTVPNKLIKLSPDGTVLFSMRFVFLHYIFCSF